MTFPLPFLTYGFAPVYGSPAECGRVAMGYVLWAMGYGLWAESRSGEGRILGSPIVKNRGVEGTVSGCFCGAEQGEVYPIEGGSVPYRGGKCTLSRGTAFQKPLILLGETALKNFNTFNTLKVYSRALAWRLYFFNSQCLKEGNPLDRSGGVEIGETMGYGLWAMGYFCGADFLPSRLPADGSTVGEASRTGLQARGRRRGGASTFSARRRLVGRFRRRSGGVDAAASKRYSCPASDPFGTGKHRATGHTLFQMKEFLERGEV